MDPTARFADEYARAAQRALEHERLWIAAQVLTCWRIPAAAGDAEWMGTSHIPADARPIDPSHAVSPHDYRARVCRQALAWADSLIAEAAHKFES